MSVVIFLPLLLTKVGNNNFWATMKQNKQKKPKKKKIQNPKKKPKLLVHLVNKEELWAFNKSVLQK